MKIRLESAQDHGEMTIAMIIHKWFTEHQKG